MFCRKPLEPSCLLLGLGLVEVSQPPRHKVTHHSSLQLHRTSSGAPGASQPHCSVTGSQPSGKENPFCWKELETQASTVMCSESPREAPYYGTSDSPEEQWCTSCPQTLQKIIGIWIESPDSSCKNKTLCASLGRSVSATNDMTRILYWKKILKHMKTLQPREENNEKDFLWCYRQDHCACVEQMSKNIRFKLVFWQTYGSCSVLLHRT